MFAASDGLFNVNPLDNRPFLRDEEILRHSMEDNVEKKYLPEAVGAVLDNKVVAIKQTRPFG